MTTPTDPDILATWSDWTVADQTAWSDRVEALEATGVARSTAERMAAEEMAGRGEHRFMSGREPVDPRDDEA
ncbi:MAG: hypothetical protein AB7P99_06355 [Vicinamibacterales bacterium]